MPFQGSSPTESISCPASTVVHGQVPIMSDGDSVTQAEEAGDLFPVRDIQAYSGELAIQRFKEPKRSSRSLERSDSEDEIDFSLNIEGLTISQIGKKCFRLSQVAYAKACIEASDAIHDVRNTWIGTNGSLSEKTKVTSRLLMYYLIILALHVIKSCFWVDRKLLEGLYITILNSKKNTQMLVGLGIVLSLILVAYVIGAPCPELQTVCDK